MVLECTSCVVLFTISVLGCTTPLLLRSMALDHAPSVPPQPADDGDDDPTPKLLRGTWGGAWAMSDSELAWGICPQRLCWASEPQSVCRNSVLFVREWAGGRRAPAARGPCVHAVAHGSGGAER